MNELDWRRRWKPDFRAKSWFPLSVNGENFLVKAQLEGGSCHVMLTDTKAVWYEELDEDAILKRNKKLNPGVEAPIAKLLEHIRENLEEPKKTTTFSVSYKHLEDSDDEKIMLTINTKLAGLPFTWRINGFPADSSMVAEHLTMPLLAMVGELSRRQQELVKIIHAKDKQIDDYKNQGAKVSRRQFETGVFDEDAFLNNMSTAKGMEEHLLRIGQAAFSTNGQALYRELMTKQAWLTREPATELEGDSLAGDATAGPGTVAPSVSSWTNRVPASLAKTGASPSVSPQKSPASSPVKSPTKDASPAKDAELLRRQALEKRLAEEEIKQQQKANKKKKKIKF